MAKETPIPSASTSSVDQGNDGIKNLVAPQGPVSESDGAGVTPATTTVPDLGQQEEQAQHGPGKKPPFGERPACFRSTFQEIAFVSQATVATATSSFLQGASAIITASIGRDLGMTQGEITWISASSALTAGAFQLGLGQLADLLGRKAVFIIGMGSFSAFVLLVSFAQDPFWMDVVMGILGVCSAMVVPPAIGIMGAAYDKPSKRKNMAFSAFSAGNPLGFVFGSILSGVATKLFNWRAAYVLMAIIWFVFTVAAFWTIPKVEAYPPDQPFKERVKIFLKTFDSVGTVLTIFGTGLLTAAITLGPTDGWKSAHVIAMLILGVVLLVVFGFWERVFPTPLMPPHIWKDRNFTLIIMTSLLGFMGFIVSNFWLALYMQEIQNLAPLEVAVHLLPQAIAGMTYNLIAGSVLHRVNNTALLAMGACAYVGSNVLLSLMSPDSIYWAFVFTFLVLAVVGADFQFNVSNMYVMQSLPSHQQALAGGIFNTLFRLGTAVGLGLSTAVYSSVAETPERMINPALPFTRAFQVAIGLSAASFLFLPFVRLGTQGHSRREDNTEDSKLEASPVAPAATPGLVAGTTTKEQ
ncbi:major facilitator superfamily domain-containing protein [Bombardia bombarda]|uniref:Major facilitator superfamily domain-containing protein n=1 Tax=Bombardia bombarda TaxID=252184 RepID=A0AA40C940_9PEZI|nr:major facilitator superfamily domain-containing protein [Bombardia bombarda]